MSAASPLAPATPAAPAPAARAAPIPELDGLRGIAILLVVVHNFGGAAEESRELAVRLFNPIHHLGWIGVQLFFALSGFLITGILLDTKGREGWLRAFYARRALRIFPLYYLVVVAWAYVAPLVLALPDAIRGEMMAHRVWYVTYLSNWLLPFGEITGLPHFWSLGVEEQFYAVWPFVVLGLGPRGLARLCAVLAVAPLLFRVAVRRAGLPEGICYAWTIARVDALALGALAALVPRDASIARAIRPWIRPAAIASFAGAVAIAAWTKSFPRAHPLVQTAGYSLLAVLFAAIVLVAATTPERLGRARAAIASRPMRALGKYSYAIYVFHVPIHVAASRRIGHVLNEGPGLQRVAATAAYIAVGGALSVAAGVISWRLIEERLLSLKRRFEVGPARAAR